LHSADEFGATPLLVATIIGSEEITKYLLTQTKDIYANTSFGRNCIFVATIENYDSIHHQFNEIFGHEKPQLMESVGNLVAFGSRWLNSTQLVDIEEDFTVTAQSVGGFDEYAAKEDIAFIKMATTLTKMKISMHHLSLLYLIALRTEDSDVLLWTERNREEPIDQSSSHSGKG
jgi:hypothetical protein